MDENISAEISTAQSSAVSGEETAPMSNIEAASATMNPSPVEKEPEKNGVDPPAASEEETHGEDPEAEIKESEIYKDLEGQLSNSEMENLAFRLQEEQRAEEAMIAEAAVQKMQADLDAIRAIDPSVQSLEDLQGYAELTARGITGTDAYYILQGQKAVEDREDLQQFRIRQEMQADLDAIRAIDPSVQSLEDIQDYAEMAERGITGEDAYFIAKGKAAWKAEQMPISPGVVGGLGDVDRDLTSAEIDRIPRKELLENPTLYAKVMRSLANSKKIF